METPLLCGNNIACLPKIINDTMSSTFDYSLSLLSIISIIVVHEFRTTTVFSEQKYLTVTGDLLPEPALVAQG